MPKISVITVCFNAAQYIEQTIKSVINQKDCDIEYIIVDGLSTDETTRIIKKYESKIAKWVSEPDKGIADAMNKGIALATGDYLMFLHADDYFADLHVVSKALCRMKSGVDIYAFDILYQTAETCERKRTRKFGLRTYFKTPVMHQGAFCKKSLFESLNSFDDSYRIAMDYDFFYRAYQMNASMEICDEVVSVMRDTGVSSRQDWVTLKQRFSEEKRVHYINNTSSIMMLIYTVYWALYFPYRKLKYAISH